MYSKNKNISAMRSQARIAESLLELMETCPYSDITITDITKHADVVRKTFYRNFETKDDILDFMIDYALSQYKFEFSTDEGAYSSFLRLFVFIADYKKYFMLFYNNGLFYMLKAKLISFINNSDSMKQIRAMLSAHRHYNYIVSFIASVVCSVVESWSQEKFKETPQEMARLTDKLISGAFGQ